VLANVPSATYPLVPARGVRPVSAYVAMALAGFRHGRRRPVDVVYFRNGTNVLAPALGRALGARVAVEVNADVQEFLAVERAPSLTRSVFAWTESVNVRGSDIVVTLTDGLKRTLVARHGLEPARVHVVPSGTDPDHFLPVPPAEARRALGLDPARPLVGFVGLCYRHQGVPTLLAALARLGAPVEALVVGDGVMRPAWEELARDLGVADRVRFTGAVAYADVPAYLNAMDVVVAPFTGDRGETSPFKVLDAMACARPVVASDLPSVRALADGAAVLVPPDDPGALGAALAALLADAGAREALGRAGRARVLDGYTWPRVGAAIATALGAPAPRAVGAGR
jgi:glycosyltransferase involved in cell wall biosynthesis